MSWCLYFLIKRTGEEWDLPHWVSKFSELYVEDLKQCILKVLAIIIIIKHLAPTKDQLPCLHHRLLGVISGTRGLLDTGLLLD